MSDFYKLASNILKSILLRKASLVSGTLGNQKIPPTLKRRIEILMSNPKYTDIQILPILHDFFFARGGISHEKSFNPLKAIILKNKTLLSRCYDSLKEKKEFFIPIADPPRIQRYARVNMLKTSVEKVKNIPYLLVFPAGTDLINLDLYKSGEIIFQDKASCFPAFILNPPLGSTIIDACAAPGNKTSHLASIINNTGKIFAYDLDIKRLDILKKQTDFAGCTCIEANCGSFLDIDPYSSSSSKIEYILLDPSCSGSGIVSRSFDLSDSFISNYFEGRNYRYSVKNENFRKQTTDSNRLDNLSNFQVSMLLHAMK
ncbi:hypothetical protein BB560_006372, partial [Smittium megazygosporum]